MKTEGFFLYLAVVAGVTYIIRMFPLVLFRKKFGNRYLRSFLYYIPYSILGVMTFPAVLYSTGNTVSAAVGTLVALVVAFFEKGMITVALSACGAVLVTELLQKLVF